jgi:hypothetical protein
VLNRLAPVLGVFALVATACGSPDIVVRSGEPEGPSWFSLVVDSTNDAGAGLSLATDADGNPHLAYVAMEEEVEGEAPAPDPLAPTVPAVMHAHLVQEAWTRGPVAEDQELDVASSDTAIAVGSEGTHHVAWADGMGHILYATNAEGEFAEPEVVAVGTAGVPTDVSMAVDDEGAPWIAFRDQLPPEPDGYPELIQVGTPGSRGWDVETAIETVSRGGLGSTAIGMTADGPIVAFGARGTEVNVARRQGARWVGEIVDPAGGQGVGMDVDADGNPHLAYLTAGGDVKHAHSIDGGPWEVSDVGSRATGSPASIAVDAEGVHHVAWQTSDGLAYAGNAGGEFAEEELPASTAEGVRPRVGAGADGTVYVAFRDGGDTEVQMAVRSEDEPLLAVPSAEETGGGGPAPTGPPPCEPEGTELSITAQNIAFDTDCLAAPVGEAFTVEFNNQDSTPPHNFAIYTDQSAVEAIFQGEIFPGPATETYDVDPIEEEGSLFFRCDVHPTTMTGTFVVAAAGG